MNDQLLGSFDDRMNGHLCYRNERGLGHDQEGSSRKTVCITCLAVTGPKIHILFHAMKPLLSGLLGLTERARVEDTAVVFVQVFCEKSRVFLFKSPSQLVDEPDSRGFGAGHWGDVRGVFWVRG